MEAFDVVIIGSGLAGQSLALRLADHRRVAIVTKRSLTDSASAWAQGGIAAVLDPTDSVESHIDDTFDAGAGLNSLAATQHVVENSRRAIEWLIDRGVPFTRDDSAPTGYHLTREGRTAVLIPILDGEAHGGWRSRGAEGELDVRESHVYRV